MNHDPTADVPDDPELRAAGEALRADTAGLTPDGIRAAALGRRSRRLGVLAGVSILAVAVLGGVLVAGAVRDGHDTGGGTATATDGAGADEIDSILSDLPAEPVDPTGVKLVRTVSTFDSCEALVDDLRRVGAAHVGSRGFGGGDWGMPGPWGYAADEVARSEASADSALPRSEESMTGIPSGGEGETLGTNVQVDGVDEPDHVKAADGHLFDLGPKGDLRITDASTGEIVGSVPVTSGERSQVDQLLVADGRVAVFGTDVEISDAIEGDPSATRLSTALLTVTLVDATDPVDPTVIERARIDGSLVSARLVGDEIRLVTTSSLADIGMVLPTTPRSVATALDANRRAVAGSEITDWIPNWDTGGDRHPLVPCERVHVPDTFAGVAMTSMITFPIDGDSFQPTGTGLLAPADVLYAGVDRVTVSAGVWVDPIDRDELRFDDWETAIHEFTFSDDGPTYEGSGIVDGSVVSQFAFGEIGDDLAVVTGSGTPWGLDRGGRVDLTVLHRAGSGELEAVATIDDLADGRGAVGAVRFLPDRILVSTGTRGRDLAVIDVSDPASPRRAGSLELGADVGYLHPLADGRALVFGSRWETVGTRPNQMEKPWVRVQLLDVGDADAPTVLDTWEREWSGDELAWDHHALTWWPGRDLALWGLMDQRWDEGERPNLAAVLGVGEGLTETAIVDASRPPETPAPCEIVPLPEELRGMVGDDATHLRCDDDSAEAVEWPGWSCWRIPTEMAEAEAEPEQPGTSFFCDAAGPPTVSRVLVVDGIPVLYTDQTLEILDPETFESATVHARANERIFDLW